MQEQLRHNKPWSNPTFFKPIFPFWKTHWNSITQVHVRLARSDQDVSKFVSQSTEYTITKMMNEKMHIEPHVCSNQALKESSMQTRALSIMKYAREAVKTCWNRVASEDLCTSTPNPASSCNPNRTMSPPQTAYSSHCSPLTMHRAFAEPSQAAPHCLPARNTLNHAKPWALNHQAGTLKPNPKP